MYLWHWKFVTVDATAVFVNNQHGIQRRGQNFDIKHVNTPCLKKIVQICFCQNFVKFTPILIILGRKMAMRLKLCEVHSFYTSPNSHHHTTVLNADVPNCYRTLKVDICNKLSNDLLSTQQTKMWFI